ncbi:MAG TPA: hypothetical protein VHG91_07915 [Longimicrobium sp.]|nr:hypothetical protein [Longimicrobium sp.]
MTTRSDILRFPFSQTDLDRMPDIPGVVDIPDDAPLARGEPVPRTLMLVTAVSNPDAGAPQVRPLFPGRIRFFADTTAPGVLPDPATIVLSEAAHAGWITVGRLMVTVEEKAVTKALDAFAAPAAPLADALADPVADPPEGPDIEVAPNVVWYDRVRISWAFLDTTLAGLRKEAVKYDDGTKVSTGAADWKKHAVAGFLSGTYAPLLRLGADAAADDVARFPMPTVDMDAGGTSILHVTTARAERPQDYADEAYETELGLDGALRDDPVHFRNGPIPARHVLRSLQADFAEVPTGAVPAAVLAEFPVAPRYRPVRFTRTWQPVPNNSIFFAFATATFTAPDGTVAGQGRLPSHGIFYLREEPLSTPPDPRVVDVTLDGGSVDFRWLPGELVDGWQEPGTHIPVTCDFGFSAVPHVVVRLPMTAAMLIEDPVEGMPGSCTYISMRRTVRALVDNRICGGRLGFGVGKTSSTTRAMMREAFASSSLTFSPKPTEGTLANNLPHPLADPTQGALALRPVLQAFFPGIVPAEEVEGSTNRVTELDGGKAAFDLWQSVLEVLNVEATRSNFSNDHVGRGGAGALAARDLGAFHVDPARQANESDEDYFDRIVTGMLSGLEPGAVLQFWEHSTTYEAIKARQTKRKEDVVGVGHSPVFHRYETDPATGALLGIVIYDQNGLVLCPVREVNGKKRMDWGSFEPEIWVAANWIE